MAEADDTAETTADELPKLPGYRIERVIGRGSTGVVYLAEDEKIERRVALKVVFPALSGDDVFRRRFERESRIAASLTHPNVVPVLGSGRAAGQMFITMPFMSGGDLRRLLETEGALGLERATAVIGAIGEALDAAHAQDMIHRDVKPANILIDGDGAERRYHLSDFGIAKVMASTTNLTSTGQFLGTLDYISPEQIQSKEMDGRADLYSLGCVLHECLTGKPPFVRDGVGPMMFAHISDAPPSVTRIRPELPAGIDAVVAKALAKNPAERFTTCAELTAALRQLIADPTSSPVSLSEAPTLTGAVSPTATAETLTGMVPNQAPVTSGMTSTYRAPVLPKAWEPPAAPAATTRSASPRIRLLAGALAAVIAVGLTVTGVAYAHNRFPTETEQSLIDQVPMAFKSTCTRNDDAEQDSDNVQASVICSPPNAEVNSYALTKYTSPTALEQQYRAAFAHAASATGPVADGDCGSSDRANGTYRDDSGRANGHVLCYRQRGSSYLTWTDSGSQTLASAARYDPDQKKLREWWADVQGVKLTTPVATTQTPPEPLSETLLPPDAALGPPPSAFSQKISAVRPPGPQPSALLLGSRKGGGKGIDRGDFSLWKTPGDDDDKDGDSKDGDSKDGDSKDGDSKDGDSKDGDSKDGDSKDGDSKDGDSKDGDSKDGDSKDGDSKDGDSKDGDSKDGDSKDGDSKDGDSKAVVNCKDASDKDTCQKIAGQCKGDEATCQQIIDRCKTDQRDCIKIITTCQNADDATCGQVIDKCKVEDDCRDDPVKSKGPDIGDLLPSPDGSKVTLPVDSDPVRIEPKPDVAKPEPTDLDRLKQLKARLEEAKRQAEAEAAAKAAAGQPQDAVVKDPRTQPDSSGEAALLDAARRAAEQKAQQEAAKQAAAKQQQAQQQAEQQAANQQAQQEAGQRAAEKQQQQQQAEALAAKQAAQQQAQQEAANKQQAQQESQQDAAQQQAQQEAANKQAQQEANQQAQQQAQQEAKQQAQQEANQQAEQEARQKAQEERTAAREAAQQAAQERAAERAAARQKAAQSQSTTTAESGTTSEGTSTDGTSTGGTSSQRGTGQTCTSEEVEAGTCTE